uniref:Uncharacterized protein n=1 Tax=Knipowitschia caucasica TaxID=637954 RepID=A0AAV2JUM0_KNICA
MEALSRGSFIYENIAKKKLSPEELLYVSEGEEALARAELRGLRRAKMARVGSSVLNGLLVLANGFFLYQDTYALAQGTETELSHWIRAWSALWRVEIEAFQKRHNSQCEAQKDYEANQESLNPPMTTSFCAKILAFRGTTGNILKQKER